MIKSTKYQHFLFFGAVAVLLGLFFLPPIENRTEAEDAYSYALDVETHSFGQLLHRNHRLYHPLAKAVFLASGQERSFGVLIAFSGVMAVAAMAVFFFLCMRLTRGDQWQSLAWTGCLAFSYGFWRYSREVEAYSLAWFVSLVAITCFFFSKQGWRQGIIFALLVVLTLNFHRALGPPLAVIAIGYLLFKKQWVSSLIALVSGLGLYFLVEEASQFLPRAPVELREVVSSPSEEVTSQGDPAQKSFGISSFPKAAIGLGACLLGGNIVMSSDSIFDILQNKVFRYRFLQEEKMMTRDVSGLHLLIWGGGVLVLAVLMVITLKLIFERRKPLLAAISPEGGALLLGSLSYAGMIVIFEPGNPEMWLLGLPLFWLSAVLLVGDLFSERVWFFVLFFGLTSYLGGISLLGSEKNDYHRATSELVRKEASDGDYYLLGSNNMVHIRFIRYQKDLRVISVLGGANANSGYLNEVRAHLQQGGRVFAHQTFCDSFNDFEAFLTQEGLMLSHNSEGGSEIQLGGEK